MNNILKIGITGHRDIREQDKDILRQSVRTLFKMFRTDYPDKNLALLSPLAEGADTLVAQVALEENITLIVPLPLPVPQYLLDFETPDVFTEILQQARTVIEMPQLDTPENLSTYGTARDQQYVQVGAYVANQSHLLIALWDGLPLDKAGGTSQVVTFKLTGKMKDWDMNNTKRGYVYHIITPRKSGETLKNIGDIRVLLPKNR